MEIEMKTRKLTEFNLEAAKNGAQLWTRNGLKARIVAWDVANGHTNEPMLCALIMGKDYTTVETPVTLNQDGTFLGHGCISDFDLFIEDTSVVGYVNVYKDLDPLTGGSFITSRKIFETEGEAVSHAKSWVEKNGGYLEYVGTKKIEL